MFRNDRVMTCRRHSATLRDLSFVSVICHALRLGYRLFAKRFTPRTPELLNSSYSLSTHLLFPSRCRLLTSLTWSVKLLGMLPSLWMATGGGHDNADGRAPGVISKVQKQSASVWKLVSNSVSNTSPYTRSRPRTGSDRRKKSIP